MKYIVIVGVTLFAVLPVFCTAQKKDKKVAYEFPKEMAANIQAEYTKICEKGQILYNLNCAGCHNIPDKRKTIIPDFTQEQLKGYELRVSNPKHESDLPETKITPEELGLICTFLLYKKKSEYIPAK
jgi:hypothetical protein